MPRFLVFFLLCVPLVLGGCVDKLAGKPKVRSHGAAITGYGPIQFGMGRDRSYQLLQGRGQFQFIPAENREVLTYMDYVGYLQVQVLQFFNEQQKADEAVLQVVDAGQGSKTLNECKGFYNILSDMLQKRYGYPDWEPRVNSRSFGETGITMYTFRNSSFIELTYDFVSSDMLGRSNGLCKVKMKFHPPWA